MKKKIVLSLIALVAATSISAFADINIEVNGKNVPFSTSDNYGVPFVDENNRTLVPFRKTLEFAGATVDWIADSKTAVAKRDGIEVKVPIGEKFIYIDGELESIDTQAIIKEGRTYLPIRAVLEALEYEISWDQSTQTVVAQTEEYVEEYVLYDEGEIIQVTNGGNTTQMVRKKLVKLPYDDVVSIELTENQYTYFIKVKTISTKEYHLYFDENLRIRPILNIDSNLTYKKDGEYYIWTYRRDKEYMKNITSYIEIGLMEFGDDEIICIKNPF